MKINMIGYPTLGLLLFYFLETAVADSGCSAVVNSQEVKRGENIIVPIDHDTKEYDVFLSLNDNEIVRITCRNGDCKLDIKKPGSRRIVYENGILTIMNSCKSDEGIYKIFYKGGSREKNKTSSCFSVTVIDDDNLPSTIIPDPPSIDPSHTPAPTPPSDPASTISLETLTITTLVGVVFGVVGVVFGVVGVVFGVVIGVVGVVGVVGAVIFVINRWCPKKKRDNSDADVGAGDSGEKPSFELNLLNKGMN